MDLLFLNFSLKKKQPIKILHVKSSKNIILPYILVYLMVLLLFLKIGSDYLEN